MAGDRPGPLHPRPPNAVADHQVLEMPPAQRGRPHWRFRSCWFRLGSGSRPWAESGEAAPWLEGASASLRLMSEFGPPGRTRAASAVDGTQTEGFPGRCCAGCREEPGLQAQMSQRGQPQRASTPGPPPVDAGFAFCTFMWKDVSAAACHFLVE